jgi:putative endonuclease
MEAYVVYIIRCHDGTLYTGIATDVVRRFNLHASGKGAKYTRAHPVAEIVYVQNVGTRSQAQEREAAIKKLSRTKKLALIMECPYKGTKKMPPR